MKVLSIGNSFSQDAQRYLHLISKKEEEEFITVNLMIPGCPLWKHYRNMLSEEKAYGLESNGNDTSFKVSLKEALLADNWDVITLQQNSLSTCEWNNFAPYVKPLAEYIRKMCPAAKLYVHQTWGYENGSGLLESVGCSSMEDMSGKVFANYDRMAKEINTDGIIRDGEAMLELSRRIPKVHRDTFHASYGVGRYMLSCMWYSTLTGKEITNDFDYFDCECSDEEIKAAKAVVEKIVFNK